MTDKKKKLLLFGGIGVICITVILILVLFAGQKSAEDPGAQMSGDDKEKEHSSVEEPEVEMTAYEDGAYPLEKAMMQSGSYDQVYEGLSEFFQTMYTGGSAGLIDGASLPDTGATDDSQGAIVFSAVPDYPDAAEDLYLSDGSYGYFVKKDQSLSVIRLEDASIQSVIAGFEHPDEYIIDIQLIGDRLILINSYAQTREDALGTIFYQTMVYTYDISDRTQPVAAGSIEIEGYYMGSRMTDHGFYVYTGCHKDGFISEEGTLLSFESLDPSAYVPSVNQAVIPADQIYRPEKVTDNFYMTVAMIDAAFPEEPKDVRAFLSVDTQYYPGEDGLILLLQNGLYQVSSTVLVRLDFTEDGMALVSAGSVSGGLIGEGSICETKGQLKVVSTDHFGEKNQNNFYLFDDQFNILAKKEDLANGALIQSVRFINERAYLATYGDKPIVAVDFSDDKALKETAYAKPDGFDGLLCGFGENRILGIGYIMDHASMDYKGIRLTVFDVSDESQIHVTDTMDIQADTTPVATTSAALFLEPELGLIGFSTEDWDEGYTHVDNFYRVFAYTPEDGLTNVLNAPLSQGNGWKSRGFLADPSGNTFFVMDQDAGVLKQYDRGNGFAQTGEVQY